MFVRVTCTLSLIAGYVVLAMFIKLRAYPGWTTLGFLTRLESAWGPVATVLAPPLFVAFVVLFRREKQSTWKEALATIIDKNRLGNLAVVCCLVTVLLLACIVTAGESRFGRDLEMLLCDHRWPAARKALERLDGKPIRPSYMRAFRNYLLVFEYSDEEIRDDSAKLENHEVVRDEVQGDFVGKIDYRALNAATYVELIRLNAGDNQAYRDQLHIVAKQLLARLRDGGDADFRIHMALGRLEQKRHHYTCALGYFEVAHDYANDELSSQGLGYLRAYAADAMSYTQVDALVRRSGAYYKEAIGAIQSGSARRSVIFVNFGWTKLLINQNTLAIRLFKDSLGENKQRGEVPDPEARLNLAVALDQKCLQNKERTEADIEEAREIYEALLYESIDATKLFKPVERELLEREKGERNTLADRLFLFGRHLQISGAETKEFQWAYLAGIQIYDPKTQEKPWDDSQWERIVYFYEKVYKAGGLKLISDWFAGKDKEAQQGDQ